MRPIRLVSVTVVALLLPGCVGSEGGDDASDAVQVAAAALTQAGGVAALDQEDEPTYRLEAKGEVEFAHSGGVICDVYRKDLRMTFMALPPDFATEYGIAVSGFEGAGDYEGTVTIEKGGGSSEGPVKLKTKLQEGGILPVLSGSIAGDYEGDAGSGTVEGSFSCPTDLGDVAAVSEGPKSGAWVEYTVSGDVTLSGREEEVVMCSELEDGFQARTLGSWFFTLEADGIGPGDHAVRFTVSAPEQVEALHSDDVTKDRLKGDGTLTLESAGKDNFGLDAVRVRFSATGLKSDAGRTIDVKGSLFCGMM